MTKKRDPDNDVEAEQFDRSGAEATDDADPAVPQTGLSARRSKRRLVWPILLAGALAASSWAIAQAATLPPLAVVDAAAGAFITDSPQSPIDAPVPSAKAEPFGPQLEVILPPPPPPPPPAARSGGTRSAQERVAAASAAGVTTTAQWCEGKYGATASASSLDGLLTAANAERARFGLGALSWSSSLASSAQGWSNTMAASSDPGGPRATLGHGMIPSPGGQNVAAAWTTGESMSQSSAISKAHSGWMTSTGHCTNILRASFTTMGAGTASSADSKAWYSTVNFQ